VSPPPLTLEVIATSIEDALAAEQGGAGRIELVRDLRRGGLTPPLELVQAVLGRVRIPVRVMIREADGYAAGGRADIEQLAATAGRMASLGVDGLVFGFLRGGRVDEAAMEAVAGAIGSSRATFHRAFDDLPDAAAALQRLTRWPTVDRVLTSGGSGDWSRRCERMRRWAAVTSAIGILAGGGVDLAAVRVLAAAGHREAHVGRAARVPATVDGQVSSDNVARLVAVASS
jgi:copper homeostasis protein